MVEEMGNRGENWVEELMMQATMPGAEADDPELDEMRNYVESGNTADGGVRADVIDWIRYGQLLRARLGWDDYPEFP
jgi:CubicO group peptidase (beta-lactamase class C family)